MKIAILGQGYVGQSIGFDAARVGHEVIGLDLNVKIINEINSKTLGLKYLASLDEKLICDVDIAIIAVPTPLDEFRNPDLSNIATVCKTLVKNLKKRTLIINESTSYPGTLRNQIAGVIERESGVEHLYASSPERVDPGNKKWNQKNTPRLLAGLTPEATTFAREFYLSFCDEIVEVSSPEVAEAAKLFENTFRQVNIALVNEFAQISHALDIPTREVLDAAATKPFGFMKFQPGPGVGGHCIPIDPSYLAHVAELAGVPAEFIRHANKINLGMPAYIVSRVANDVGPLKGKKVVVVGVTYKANVRDTRETPAALVISELQKLGAEVSWHDPLIDKWLDETSSELKGFDVAIVVTKHDVVSEADIKGSASYVFDCTGSINGVSGL